MREHQRSRSKEPAGSDWGFGRLHGPPPPLLTTTQILSKVQLASILPLKSPTSFHTSSQKSNQLPYFPSKSNHTFHTSSQKSINLPYCLSKVQPPSILPRKCPTSLHTFSQKSNHLPYFLSKVQPVLFGTSAVIFFYKNGRSWKINSKVPNRLSCWGLKKGHWRNPIATTDFRAEIRNFGPKKNNHFLIQTMS